MSGVKMDPAKKALWTEALRSGRFAQGTGALKYVDVAEDGEETDRYCCLGVLCALAQEQAGIEWDHDNGYLPREVAQWAGMHTVLADQSTRYETNPLVTAPTRVYPSGSVVTLANVNDTLEWDFEAIADLIEEQL